MVVLADIGGAERAATTRQVRKGVYDKRDPKRIPRVMKALEVVWRANPDLRPGPLIVNSVSASGQPVVCSEVFYVEDDAMFIGISRWRERLAPIKDKVPPRVPRNRRA